MTTARAWILVPGWGADATAFDAVTSRLPGIATRVVGWDALCERGRQALDEAAEALGPGPVGLSGWSLGALLALDAALAAPGRFAALALVSATARFCGDGEGHPGAEPRSLRAMSLRLARDPAPVLRAFAAACAAPDGGATAADQWLAQAQRFPADALARGLAALSTLDLRARLPALATLDHRPTLPALSTLDRRPELPALLIPVRLLHGDADGIVPLAAARALARDCPDARLTVIPGRGHALPFTAPEAVAQLLLEAQA